MNTISERAAIARINRKLAHEEQVLRTSRGARAYLEFGRYYIRDWRLNIVVETHCDIESLAHELGVLPTWQSISGNEIEGTDMSAKEYRLQQITELLFELGYVPDPDHSGGYIYPHDNKKAPS